MVRKTYIVTVDEKSSFTGVMPMPAYGSSRYDKVTITRPVSVAALDGNPKLYTSEVLDKERQAGEQAGQNEAWDLARKILKLPGLGGYTDQELCEIFNFGAVPVISDLIRRYTYQEVADKVKKWEETANIRVGDVLVSPTNFKALVTCIGDDYMCLLFSDGSCGQIVKDDIKEFYKKTDQRFDLTAVVDLLKEEE